MNSIYRNIALIILILLSSCVLPALMGTSLVELMEEDDFQEDDFLFIDSFLRMHCAVCETVSALVLGLSIFNLVVVYRGGRSGHARFNDRTLDAVNFSNGLFFQLKATLQRVVFIFFFGSLPLWSSAERPERCCFPILFSSTRRY